jgi:signal transduction histidine kinase
MNRRTEVLHGGRSRTATRVAFFVIVAFVLAQVAWWMVFQERALEAAAAERAAAWTRDVATANELLAADPAALVALLERYPHLRAAGDGRLAIDPEAQRAVEAATRSTQRMFAFEGPFFALVILGMLWLIAGSLRVERELKRRQQNFLSAVTHEFMTPIGTLRLLVQTLQLRPASPERTVAYLRKMETELDRLERTSDQVLASARLQHADAPPVLAAADLNTVVQGHLGRARAGLEERGAVLEIAYAPESLPVSLDVDAFAIVLHNLLDNAVKYDACPQKRIRVSMHAEGDLVHLHVDDAGPGLTREERERVFDRFYRAGDEMTRTTTGVGIGLHLVRTIVESLHGWVRAEENPAGAGARFTVVLPRRVAAAEKRAPAGGGARTAEARP